MKDCLREGRPQRKGDSEAPGRDVALAIMRQGSRARTCQFHWRGNFLKDRSHMHPTWLRPRNPMSFLSSMAESSSTVEVVKRRWIYVRTSHCMQRLDVKTPHEDRRVKRMR